MLSFQRRDCCNEEIVDAVDTEDTADAVDVVDIEDTADAVDAVDTEDTAVGVDAVDVEDTADIGNTAGHILAC